MSDINHILNVLCLILFFSESSQESKKVLKYFKMIMIYNNVHLNITYCIFTTKLIYNFKF